MLERYLKVSDLYAVGHELALRDGSLIWLQVLNPMQRDDAIAAAAIARARVALALDDPEADEYLKLRATFTEDAKDGVIERLVEAKRGEAGQEAFEEMNTEDEWKDKIAALRNTDELVATPTASESAALKKALIDFSEEHEKRVAQILEAERAQFGHSGTEDLWDAYVEWWLDVRGSQVGIVEYRYAELKAAARACEATLVEGRYDHAACDSHRTYVFDSLAEIRELPEKFLAELFDALRERELSESEVKEQAPAGSSPVSSASPSEQEASTPSTQAAA